MAFNISYIYIAKDRFTAIANRVGASADRVNNRIAGLQTPAIRSQVAMNKLQNSVGKFAVAAGALFVLTKPIRQAIEFESALADLNKVMEFELPGGLQKVGKELGKLSTKMPVTALGLTEIAIAGAQFGIAEKDILGFTKTVAKISVAFDILPSEAGLAVAKLSNIFQIPADEFESFADSINIVSNKTASSAAQIVSALQNKAAAAGQIMGLSARETTGLASTFIQLGVNANRVGSIMDSMSRRLTDTKIVGEEFAQAFADNPMEELQGLLSKINKLQGVEKANALSQIFGEFSGRVGLLASTMEEKLIPTLELATNVQAAAGSVQKEFSSRIATTDAKIKMLKNRFGEISKGLGQTLLPLLSAGVTAFGFIAGIIAFVIRVTGPLAPMILAAAVAFGVIALAGAAFAVIMAIIGVIVTANPLGLLIVALAAVAAGVVWVIKKFKDMGGIKNVLKKFAQSVINFMVRPLMKFAALSDTLFGTNFVEKLQGLTTLDALKVDVTSDINTSIAANAGGAQKVTFDANINVNAPPGVIQSIESRSGGAGRADIGQNMVGAVFAHKRGGF